MCGTRRTPTKAAANSATNSRFTRCTVPLPTPTSAATLRMPLPALRCLLIASSIVGGAFSPAGACGQGRQGPCCV